MRRPFYAIMLIIIFIVITVFQFNLSYKFRIQPPSSKWSKEVLVSTGKIALYNYPKIVNYGEGYVVAHDDADKIKVIMLDSNGKKLNEKLFEVEDDSARDVNLLTDGEYLYVDWIVYKNGTNDLLNIKLNKNLELVDKWTINDISESTQIGENILVIAHNNRIDVQDIKNGKIASVNVPVPSKLSGTLTRDGYLITYYVPYKAGVRTINGFFYFYVNDGVASEPVNIMERPTTSSELFFNTATACDDKNGYIIVERRNKGSFSNNIIITFPLGAGPGDTSTAGSGKETEFEILPTDQFIYSPGSISSGEEARFITGYAREYGRTSRQFNLLDFSIKDGKVIRTEYASRMRQASNAPYVNGDMLVYSSLLKDNNYEIYIASQNEEFKMANNGTRRDEVKLALIDVVLEILNAIFSLFTMALIWLIPGLVLVSIMSILGYKIHYRRKKIVYALICIVSTALKLFGVYYYYYNVYINKISGVLSSVYTGMCAALIISVFSYLFGSAIYFNKLKTNEDTIPFISFASVLLIDSILTQFLFTPFIM